jgi:hypothetical protein
MRPITGACDTHVHFYDHRRVLVDNPAELYGF